jgi:CheY-like chemotaxis protein
VSLKIFIVEDNEVYSQMLDYKLKESGLDDVTVFNSGEDCLSHISEKPNLVLLDFSLKGLNGLDTLNQIKKDSPKSEVIVLTGLENKKVAEQCRDAGAIEFLSKEDESISRILNYAKKSSKRNASKRRMTILLAIIVLVVLAIVLSQFIN